MCGGVDWDLAGSAKGSGAHASSRSAHLTRYHVYQSAAMMHMHQPRLANSQGDHIVLNKATASATRAIDARRMMKKWTTRYSLSPLKASLSPDAFPLSTTIPNHSPELLLAVTPQHSPLVCSLPPPSLPLPLNDLSSILTSRLSTTRSYTVVVLSACCISYVTAYCPRSSASPI